MTESTDDVSKIHKRYFLTLFTPSFYYSLIISVFVVGLLVTAINFNYIPNDDLALKLAAVIGVLLVTQYIDSKFT